MKYISDSLCSLDIKEEIRYSLSFYLDYFGSKTDASFCVVSGYSNYSKNKIMYIESNRLFNEGVNEMFDDDFLQYDNNNNVKIAASRVIGWDGVVEDGEELECTIENVERVLNEHDWIMKQVMSQSSKLDKFIASTIEDAIRWSEWTFANNSKQSDGATLKEHIENASNNPFANGKLAIKHNDDEIIKPLILPVQAHIAWSHFLRLHGQRRSGGMGVSCLCYSDILSFCELHKIKLSPWELELITEFDKAFLAQVQKDLKNS